MPTYQQNIPQPNDILADSQNDILENFQQLNTAWNINHVAFNNATQGKHTEVTLPENVAPTNTILNEANIYAQLSTLTGQTELAWQRENNGARIEWTGLLAASDGWTRFPSGILIKWGVSFGITGLNQPVLFPVAGTTPPFVTLYTIFTTIAVNTGERLTSNVISGSESPLGFNVDIINTNTGAGGTADLFYFAIGT